MYYGFFKRDLSDDSNFWEDEAILMVEEQFAQMDTDFDTDHDSASFQTMDLTNSDGFWEVDPNQLPKDQWESSIGIVKD